MLREMDCEIFTLHRLETVGFWPVSVGETRSFGQNRQNDFAASPLGVAGIGRNSRTGHIRFQSHAWLEGLGFQVEQSYFVEVLKG
jgi:hypothetical protein